VGPALDFHGERVKGNFVQLRVLPLQFLEALRRVDLHHAELSLPTVVGLLRDVLFLADLHDTFAAVGRPQNADLVFRRLFFAFHGLGLFLGPD